MDRTRPIGGGLKTTAPRANLAAAIREGGFHDVPAAGFNPPLTDPPLPDPPLIDPPPGPPLIAPCSRSAVPRPSARVVSASAASSNASPRASTAAHSLVRRRARS